MPLLSLLYVGQQISIYAGFFCVVCGVIGNGMNILVFSTFRNYRTTPCTFYFLIASVFNLLILTINLTTRTLTSGFEIDPTHISTSWCKIRGFFIVLFLVMTLTCSCLATIDQFFITSRNANLRRLSSIKWAHRIVVIFLIIWCLHGIPALIFYDISPITMTCTIINPIYNTYVPIYLLVLVCAIPLSIMVVFGCLTYRNIHLTRGLVRQHADHQLATMTLIQVLLHFICFVPYSIYVVYTFITSGVSKDINRIIIEDFILTILSLGTYFDYAGSCYMFLIVSSRFRRATKQRIFFCFRPNQVVALQPRTGVTPVVNTRERF